MPDDELFELAEAGELHNVATLNEQIDRMLADAKIDRFVEGFARQWLQTDTFLAFAPDKYLYKSYDEKLAEAAVREPLEFFRTVLEQDLSALNFIDSDFLVINERLTEHYGISGVEGEEFRRVDLPADSPRGGLLGMAGVHKAPQITWKSPDFGVEPAQHAQLRILGRTTSPFFSRIITAERDGFYGFTEVVFPKILKGDDAS